MARFAFVACLVFVFSVSAICGAEAKDPVSDEEFLWLATAAAQEANLTIDDFPAAWESEPPDPDDDSDDEDEMPEDLSPECRELFESFEATYDSADADDEDNPSAVSDDFSDPDTNEGVSTEVEVYRTVDLASEGEEALDVAFDTCGDDIVGWIEQSVNEEAEASGEGYRVLNLEMQEFSERDLGDWARDWGFSLTYDFDGFQVDATITMTFIRAGRMSGTLMHFELGESDTALIESMREVFAARLETVDDTLPE